MKVSGPTGASPAGSSRPTARAAAGFSLGAAGVQAPAQAAPARTVSGIASIDALLALQAAGGPEERRRRAVRRGGRILDVLDQVKVALLEGEVPHSALENLVETVREQREATDDPGLEQVLEQIETRAAVELAKFSRA